jgi:hypothetical protein
MGFWDDLEEMASSVGKGLGNVAKEVADKAPKIVEDSVKTGGKILQETFETGRKTAKHIAEGKPEKVIDDVFKGTKKVAEVTIDSTIRNVSTIVEGTKNVAGASVGAGGDFAKGAISAGLEVVDFTYRWGTQGIKFSQEKFVEALSASPKLSAALVDNVSRIVGEAHSEAQKQGRKILDNSAILTNAVLASDFSHEIEGWLGKTFNEGIPSVYDQAVDAVYNATHIGGGKLHRLFDESHTPWDMWDRVKDASPDDHFLQEVVGFSSAFGKDLSSTVGIPLANLTPENYDKYADTLESTLGIPREWVADSLHVNSNELLGGSIGAIAVALNWKKADVERFSKLAGSLGIASIASANPALAVVSLATLSKGYVEAGSSGGYTKFRDGLVKGGVGTGVFLGTAAVIGGPAWIGVLSGFALSSAVNNSMENYNVSDIADFLDKSFHRVIA